MDSLEPQTTGQDRRACEPLRRDVLQRILCCHRHRYWSNRCSCGERLLDDVCPELLLVLGTAVASAARGGR